MAKVGEGDARWLVQNRSDGKNVGNWHWTEKSLFPWAKEQMESRFTDYVIFEDDKHKLSFTNVESFKGEIFVNIRKGKSRFIYDVTMNLHWNAILKGAEGPEHEATGRMECIDINVTDDDFDTKFSIESGDNATGRALMQLVKEKSVPLVKKEWKAMMACMVELHAEAAKAASSPAPSTSSTPAMPTPVAVTPLPTSSSNKITTTTTSTGQTINVRTISQVVKFHTSSQSIFETLMDSQRVSAFTGSAAQISSEKGSSFKLFGGSVFGILEDAIPGQRIAQKWRFASWPENHYSQVTIELEDKGGSKCLVKLTQSGVPESDYDRTRIGWEEHFWRRIKGVFGWDYKLKN